MRIRTEISDSEEIVIRCREENDKTRWLTQVIEEALGQEDTVSLFSDGTEFFVPKGEILYFESSGGTVYAHTRDNIYTVPRKLFELESIMAPRFARVSKSAIANLMRVSSLKRELVGNGVLTFYGSDKQVWFSRAYFKLLQYKLDELRK